mgnify:FL=1
MRKLMMLSVFMAAAAFFSVSAQENPSAAEPAAQEIPVESGVSSGEKSNSIGKKLLMYIPNRLLDLLDIVSIELKSGAVIGAEARVTRAFGIGGEVGTYGSALKGYNRQYGFAVTEGAEGQFFFGSAMDLARPLVWGDIERYWIQGTNFPLPSNRIYQEKARDYWALELGASCLFGVKVSIHPVAIADFFTGLILIDVEDDDLVLKPIHD